MRKPPKEKTGRIPAAGQVDGGEAFMIPGWNSSYSYTCEETSVEISHGSSDYYADFPAWAPCN